jgi:tetratricopeptide (TPR) repeat protein
MRHWVALAAGLAITIAGIGPSAAAEERNFQICYSKGDWLNNYKEEDARRSAVVACSSLIDGGKYKGTALAAAYRARGSWKTKMDDLDGALADFAVSIRLEPGNVESFDYRADVYQRKQDFDRALADYNEASRIDPTYAAAYYSRGKIYQQKGDIDKARAEYNSALAVPTKDRIAQWAQDNARKRLKELDDTKQ